MISRTTIVCMATVMLLFWLWFSRSIWSKDFSSSQTEGIYKYSAIAGHFKLNYSIIVHCKHRTLGPLHVWCFVMGIITVVQFIRINNVSRGNGLVKYLLILEQLINFTLKPTALKFFWGGWIRLQHGSLSHSTYYRTLHRWSCQRCKNYQASSLLFIQSLTWFATQSAASHP